MNLLLRPVEVPPDTARRPFRARRDSSILPDEEEELVVLILAAAEG